MDFEQISPIQYDWIFSKTKSTSTLKQLALTEITRSLWRYTLNKSRLERVLINVLNKSAWYKASVSLKRQTAKITLKNQARKVIDPKQRKKITTSDSSKIQTIIRRRFLALQLNTIKWFHYHHNLLRDFFGYRFSDSMYIFDRFDELVYDTEDDIDYVETARKMISSDKFADVDKFIFACYYCFEDDVKKLWPSVRVNVNEVVHRRTNVYVLDMMRYWANRMRESCYKVIFTCYTECHNRSSMNWLLQQSLPVSKDAWIVLLLFFQYTPDRYAEDRLIRQSIILVKYIFPQFDAELLDRDSMFLTLRFIMISCINNEAMWQFAMPMWIRIRHMINGKTFVEILEQEYEIKSGHSHNAFRMHPQKLIEEFQCESITDEFLKNTARQIRREVWDTAPLHLREFALNHFQNRNALDKLDFLSVDCESREESNP